MPPLLENHAKSRLFSRGRGSLSLGDGGGKQVKLL